MSIPSPRQFEEPVMKLYPVSHTCINCKHSSALNLDAKWTDEMQKCLDEELENNNTVVSDPTGAGLHLPIRHFWQIHKSQYDDLKKREENNILCRRFPRYEERSKQDLCGEFSK